VAERRLIDGGEVQQEYHDEPNSGDIADAEVPANNTNTNGNTPRIEPSGLGAGEEWREGR